MDTDRLAGLGWRFEDGARAPSSLNRTNRLRIEALGADEVALNSPQQVLAVSGTALAGVVAASMLWGLSDQRSPALAGQAAAPAQIAAAAAPSPVVDP